MEVLPLESRGLMVLAAATALQTIELRLVWSADVAAVCHTLPALRHLRWGRVGSCSCYVAVLTSSASILLMPDACSKPLCTACRLHLYFCEPDHGTAAVQLLRELPQLSSATLGVHSCHDTELDGNYPLIEQMESTVELPPLASMTALTELQLAGLVQLPPDFRQLAQLQRLSATSLHGYDEDGNMPPVDWGSAPLTGLASLTHVELCLGCDGMALPGGQPEARAAILYNPCTPWHPHVVLWAAINNSYAPRSADPAVLASAPALAEVHAPGTHRPIQHAHSKRLDAWRNQLAALRPDLCITS